MAVTTSQVTTATNGDLALNPSGTGVVKFSKLATAAMPIGVTADGTIQHFKISELAVGSSLTSADTMMIQKSGETTTKKASISDIVTGGGGAKLTDLSVTTGAASNGGSLAYANTTGVFTFAPASLSDLGGIALADISVGANAAAAGGGALSYNSTSGVFTFTPADLSGSGISYTDLSLTQATAVAGGSLSYNNTTGALSLIHI